MSCVKSTQRWHLGVLFIEVFKSSNLEMLSCTSVANDSRDVQWCRVLSVIHFEIQSNYDSSLTNVFETTVARSIPSDTMCTVQGLPPFPLSPCHSIHVCQSNSGSTCTVQ